MVFVKIFMVGIAIVVLMGVARDRNWPQRAGVTGTCVRTQPPSSNPGGAWYACKQGLLTGYPALEADSCRSAGIVEHHEVWRCPAPLASLPGY
jgi:hypothetical protein